MLNTTKSEVIRQSLFIGFPEFVRRLSNRRSHTSKQGVGLPHAPFPFPTRSRRMAPWSRMGPSNKPKTISKKS